MHFLCAKNKRNQTEKRGDKGKSLSLQRTIQVHEFEWEAAGATTKLVFLFFTRVSSIFTRSFERSLRAIGISEKATNNTEHKNLYQSAGQSDKLPARGKSRKIFENKYRNLKQLEFIFSTNIRTHINVKPV